MNARYQSRQLHSAFDTSAEYTFPMSRFAPDIAKVTCMNFPMQEIAADIGIRDATAVTLAEVLDQKIQSLNSIYFSLSQTSFPLLPSAEEGQSSLALDIQASQDTLKIDGLRAEASNGKSYFCANFSVIRDAVSRYKEVAYADLDDYARALQKALMAKALQGNAPVIVFECLLNNADKEILYKADRYLRDQASNDNEDGAKIAVERKGQSLYTLDDVKNPYYPMS